MEMSKVKFILGRTGTGKTYHILNEIKDKCSSEPTGAPIFIITPEQMTFHTEYQLLRMNEGNSMIRANALSFNRLAHRVMQEVGGLSRLHLDEVGKAMLLQRIMLEKESELGIFKNYIKKPGFIQKMDELFSEFKSHQLDTELLKEKLAQSNLTSGTKEKISLLAGLYDEFNAITLAQYLTTEDYFLLLIETLEKSDLIKTANIYIDGYHTFNPQELAIIQQLAKYSKSLTLVLTADHDNEFGLWEQTAGTYANLMETLGTVAEEVITKAPPIKKTSSLTHLEQNFMQSSGKFEDETIDIAFFKTTTRRGEIEEVAKRIHQLAYDEQADFSTIAIYASNPQMDQALYEQIFAKHNIPYFLDYKATMMRHPVINLLHKVFDIFSTHWRNDTLFEVFKTGLFVDVENFATTASYSAAVLAHCEAVDELENYVLARNIRKDDWRSGKRWYYGPYNEQDQKDHHLEIQEKINKTKDRLIKPLLTLELALKEGKTVTELATAVFAFLEELEIPKQLELLVKTTEETDNATDKEKKQHEQVWTKMLGILEQIVEVATEESMLADDFVQIFKTGLEQLTFATVPATLNAVQIGDITRSRYQLTPDFSEASGYGVKYAFIIGFNDGAIPAIPAEASLLSEKERLALTELEINLAPSLIQSQKDEIFSLYTNLSAAKKSITLSYMTENEAQPSYVFNHIKEMFPVTTVEEILNSEMEPHQRLTTAEAMFNQTLLLISQENKNYYRPITDFYQTTDPIKHDIIEQAIGYHNEALHLTEAQAKELYTQDIEASVSRIEGFNKCQFAHFLSYGLRLNERDLFEMTVADIGNLYHGAVEYISRKLQDENRSFASLTSEEIKNLAHLAVDATIKNSGDFTILNSSERMKVMKAKLINVVIKTIIAMVHQSGKSEFKGSYFELKFQREQGRYQNEKNWIKTIPRKVGNVNLSLKGIIDRVDVATANGKTFVRIVDYKSKAQELKLDSVLYGQSLQLLTYLDVAINWLSEKIGEPVENAGSLYFHLHNPYTDDDSEILTRDFAEELHLNQTASYKMSGYLPNNHDVLTMSDTLLENSQASVVVPFTKNKDGNLMKSRSKILETADFTDLRQFTTQVIEEAVIKMSQGEVAINPTVHGDSNPCKWCNYKAICKFDKAPRYLDNIKPEDALAQIREKIAVKELV